VAVKLVEELAEPQEVVIALQAVPSLERLIVFSLASKLQTSQCFTLYKNSFRQQKLHSFEHLLTPEGSSLTP